MRGSGLEEYRHTILLPLPGPVFSNEGGSFLSNSRNGINMPPLDLYTKGENVHRNTNYGNPFGDVVDNSVGDNLASRMEKAQVKTEVNRLGVSLRMQSAPSWLYKDF